VRAATRGSALARWQADHVAARLRAATLAQGDEADVEAVVVETEGDRRRDVPIAEIGGKGVFAKEVQAAVLEGRADVAVHSAKDLPAVTPRGLVIAAVLERADPRDALVGAPLDELPDGAVVATGSLRRRVQLAALRADLRFVDLRGNMDTRVRRADDDDVDAVVVAACALDRLGWGERIAQRLSVDEVVPQVAQGALAVECREDDDETRGLLASIDDARARACVECERAFLLELGGDCTLPAGAHAVLDGAGIRLRAVLRGDDGVLRRHDTTASDGEWLGVAAARDLLGRP
jgi:hydroxymethylbilane synthase